MRFLGALMIAAGVLLVVVVVATAVSIATGGAR